MVSPNTFMTRASLALRNPRFSTLAEKAGFRDSYKAAGIVSPHGINVGGWVGIPGNVFYRWLSEQGTQLRAENGSPYFSNLEIAASRKPRSGMSPLESEEEYPIFPNLEIVASDKPYSRDYSTARRYLILGSEIGTVIYDQARRQLMPQPTHTGNEVLELLRSYVLK